MKNEIDFKVQFSAFCGTTFINCFTSTYIFLEKISHRYRDGDLCGKFGCENCGYCGNDGGYFFLFDTMCGRSSQRCRFDGIPTEMENLIDETNFYDGGTDDNVDFLFGFTGYEYRKQTDASIFKDEIVASVNAGRPIITKVKTGDSRFRVLIGYDEDGLICPDFSNAQHKPEIAPAYDEIDALYIIGDKTKPRYMLIDALKRIRKVIEYNIEERIWDVYIEKMGLYTADSLSNCSIEEKKTRMKRVADTMWHTFNCHNFAEVFRKYLVNGNASLYDAIGDMKKLRDSQFQILLGEISACSGYTHDLAWALIGLEACADWTQHAAGYFGEMVELTLDRIKQNDIKNLDAVNKMIEILSDYSVAE
jgi:hypothetical protein